MRFTCMLCGRTQWGAFGEIKIDNNNFQKKVKIGIKAKKDHASIIVECKSKTWTESGNAPSAKIKNWSDAMFSFYLAPEKYKKFFFG